MHVCVGKARETALTSGAPLRAAPATSGSMVAADLPFAFVASTCESPTESRQAQLAICQRAGLVAPDHRVDCLQLPAGASDGDEKRCVGAIVRKVRSRMIGGFLPLSVFGPPLVQQRSVSSLRTSHLLLSTMSASLCATCSRRSHATWNLALATFVRSCPGRVPLRLSRVSCLSSSLLAAHNASRGVFSTAV